MSGEESLPKSFMRLLEESCTDDYAFFAHLELNPSPPSGDAKFDAELPPDSTKRSPPTYDESSGSPETSGEVSFESLSRGVDELLKMFARLPEGFEAVEYLATTSPRGCASGVPAADLIGGESEDVLCCYNCSARESGEKRSRHGWSNEEHIMFLKGLRKYGHGKWKKISEFVKSRTPSQVSSHAHYCNTLLEKYGKMGGENRKGTRTHPA